MRVCFLRKSPPQNDVLFIINFGTYKFLHQKDIFNFKYIPLDKWSSGKSEIKILGYTKKNWYTLPFFVSYSLQFIKQ